MTASPLSSYTESAASAVLLASPLYEIPETVLSEPRESLYHVLSETTEPRVIEALTVTGALLISTLPDA